MALSLLLKASMTEPIANENQTPTGCLCKFSSRPFDDCYCSKVSGRSAHDIATYCMERYWECPIYQKHMQENPVEEPLQKK